MTKKATPPPPMTMLPFSAPLRRLRALRGETLLKYGVPALLGLLIALPLLQALGSTLQGEGLKAWPEVLTGRLSRNLFYLPLLNTMLLGVAVAAACVVLGGFLAWLVVMTDVPFRRSIGIMATLPFMIPSFANALAWQSLFRNDLLGGQIGFFQGLGIAVPDSLSWGMLPTFIVLSLHYFSLAFTVIAAALATVNADLVEAAQLANARGWKILGGIILPVVTPALFAAASLCFAGAVSNFAAPALLGLPVRMQTLSTRLYGMMEIGQQGRGYVIAVLLVLISAAFLWLGNKLVSGRRSYATLTGKGGRAKRFALGRLRWPLFAAAAGIVLASTVIPVIVLLASSLAPSSARLFSDWTLHYWLGKSVSHIAQGTAGIIHNPDILRAGMVTVGLGAAAAVCGLGIGILGAYTALRYRREWVGSLIMQLGNLPLLVPGIAFGAAYIALFGAPIGPFPALYGSFALLVIAGTAYLLPFALQTARAVMQQISNELEESARLTGAGFVLRTLKIFVPLSLRGLCAGGLLMFVKMIRDLSLVVLLFTPTMPLLSVLAYRYASEGFTQFANAVTVVVLLISIGVTLAANRLQAKSQPWLHS